MLQTTQPWWYCHCTHVDDKAEEAARLRAVGIGQEQAGAKYHAEKMTDVAMETGHLAATIAYSNISTKWVVIALTHVH